MNKQKQLSAFSIVLFKDLIYGQTAFLMPCFYTSMFCRIEAIFQFRGNFFIIFLLINCLKHQRSEFQLNHLCAPEACTLSARSAATLVERCSSVFTSILKCHQPPTSAKRAALFGGWHSPCVGCLCVCLRVSAKPLPSELQT